jgi:hypothetical protein
VVLGRWTVVTEYEPIQRQGGQATLLRQEVGDANL